MGSQAYGGYGGNRGSNRYQGEKKEPRAVKPWASKGRGGKKGLKEGQIIGTLFG